MLRQKLSGESIILAAILIVAGFFRFYRIDQVPPGLRFDEAFNLFDILALLQGQFAIFFPANNGREPFFNYLSIVPATLFGAQPLALRLTAAIIGTATVLLVYGFAKALFRSARIGQLAAFFLAISVWHIYYSRYGLRVILALALTILTLWFFWRGLSRRETQATRDFGLAGVFAALTAYTYLSGRLTPILLIALTLAASALDRSNARYFLKGLVVTGLVAFVLFLPLGAYFVLHPDDFLAHGASLSVWDPRVSKGDVAGTLASNLGKVAGMFFVRGDFEDFRNVPERPVFDPLIAAFFLIGLVLLLRDLFAPQSPRLARLRAMLIALAMILFLASSALSDDPPNFTRTLPTLSVLMLLPAWGVSEIWACLRTTLARQIAIGAIGVVAIASTAISFNDYFVRFANLSSLYYAFDVRMYDAGNWINQNARANQIFLAPLWYQQGTLALVTRNMPLKSFESRDTIVLPSRALGKDALYAFPLEQEKKAAKLAERLGQIAMREEVRGSTGEQLLVLYRVRAGDLPDLRDPLATLARGGDFIQPQKIERTVWDDSFALLGYSIDAADAAKRNLQVTLFFHALKPMSQDYTFSIKARDAKDRVWGQEDKWAGNNSYATTQWSPGEVVVEKFYPGLNACAPAGEYRIAVEAYNPKTMQVLALSDRDGNSMSLGTTRAEASPGNLYAHLEPEQTIDVEVAPQARLLGFTLTPDQARTGDPFSLALFWRGIGDGKQARRAVVKWRDASERDFELADKDVTLPMDGRGLCTLLDLTVPQDALAGAGAIFVNDVRIGTVQVTR